MGDIGLQAAIAAQEQVRQAEIALQADKQRMRRDRKHLKREAAKRENNAEFAETVREGKWDDDLPTRAAIAGATEMLARMGGAEGRGVEAWNSGPPPKPWADEWFIAETVYGDRVVLRALPEEYTYDFKTADDTYIKSEKIRRWMQFPDSAFVRHVATTAIEWQPIETAPTDGRKLFLAKIVGHIDHPTAIWWVCQGFWSDKWHNWNDGIEPAGLSGPTHWMLPIRALAGEK